MPSAFPVSSHLSLPTVRGNSREPHGDVGLYQTREASGMILVGRAGVVRKEWQRGVVAEALVP